MGFWTLKTENCPTLHTANDWNVYEPVSGKWFDEENVQIRKVFISKLSYKIPQGLFLNAKSLNMSCCWRLLRFWPQTE